jgi:hypothetical protein
MSEIEAIISVKNDLEPGASCCSNLQEEMESRYKNSTASTCSLCTVY